MTAVAICRAVAHVLLIYLFLRRRSSAPYVLIAVVWAQLLNFAFFRWFTSAAHLSTALSVPWYLGQLAAGAAEAGIYTAYLLRSKRVKATFVVRHTPLRSEAGAAAPPQQVPLPL
jgi:hypothetical protein